MKRLFTTLLIAIVGFNAMAQKKKVQDAGGDHFLVKGKIFNIDFVSETEKRASNVQVVIYQEKEIYVAFFTDSTGTYDFLLPIGHTYEIWYGGSAFINKKVVIDATQVPKEKKPRVVPLDIMLFRPMEGYTFPILDEPFVKMHYDAELDKVVPDMDYCDERDEMLNKQFRKIRKAESRKK